MITRGARTDHQSAKAVFVFRVRRADMLRRYHVMYVYDGARRYRDIAGGRSLTNETAKIVVV